MYCNPFGVDLKVLFALSSDRRPLSINDFRYLLSTSKLRCEAYINFVFLSGEAALIIRAAIS